RIATDLLAVLPEDGDLVLEGLDGAASKVPDVGVAGDDAQRELLTATADHEGRVGLLDRLWLEASLLELIVAAIEVNEGLGEEAPDQLAGLAETPDALAGRVERDAHAR